MLWEEIRKTYPDQWLVIEALEAHTTADQQRHLDRLAVIEPCPNARTALMNYRRYHLLYPQREFYFIHTSRQNIDIREQQWAGIRYTNAA